MFIRYLEYLDHYEDEYTMECSWCCYLRCFSDSAGARALGTVVPAGPRNKNLEEHKTKIFATVYKYMESGVSNYCIVTPACERGLKRWDRPNLSSTAYLAKLSDCMASRAFYIFSNDLFYDNSHHFNGVMKCPTGVGARVAYLNLVCTSLITCPFTFIAEGNLPK